VAGAALVVTATGAALMAGSWIGSEPARYPASVLDVVDGDTIVVVFADGRRATVRVLGVDTPETKHPTVGVECYGPEAYAFTRAVLLGAQVTIEFDREVFDKYGRLLAHVWHDGRSLGDQLLERGLAEVFVLPPNGAHARTQLGLELDARAARRGLWGAC
jgi:micrococcal nuclease